ncbi:hypothetical protein BpHYR1_015202 [Brachionus plicatilis]|uniref:Uncharacterized protein n=1 Tax=Brachionus plicatilis TaxID=10195 RepID=A0A3M7Q4W0_BRAPC|nr:hypothetical protein BpHYR1_015202 [Brachionus plicatilis]
MKRYFHKQRLIKIKIDQILDNFNLQTLKFFKLFEPKNFSLILFALKLLLFALFQTLTTSQINFFYVESEMPSLMKKSSFNLLLD